MQDNRAVKIAIGAVVVAVLTWWLVTGTFSRACSMPFESGDLQLSSSGSFGVELLADMLYVIGVAVTAALTGLGKLALNLIGRLTGVVNQPAESVNIEMLKSGLRQIRDPLRDEIAKLHDRIAALEKPSAPKPRARTKRTTEGK